MVCPCGKDFLEGCARGGTGECRPHVIKGPVRGATGMLGLVSFGFTQFNSRAARSKINRGGAAGRMQKKKRTLL